MGRRSTRRSANHLTPKSPGSNGPGALIGLLDTDEETPGFEFVPDELGGITIMVNGFPQSYVHTADPALLPFEYMQHLSAVVDVLPIGKVTATHVGGAGLTLARYVEFTRPGSPQIVFEPDRELTDKVRAELPLPRGHRIRVRTLPGEDGFAGLADDSADIVVVDAFTDGRVPAALTTPEFLAQCARVAAPAGLVAVNLPDAPGLAYVNRVVATAREAGLPHPLLIATHEVLRGKRFGNVVMVASAAPLPEHELRRRVARSAFPAGIRGEHDTRKQTATAVPIRSGESVASPQPPVPAVWRAV